MTTLTERNNYLEQVHTKIQLHVEIKANLESEAYQSLGLELQLGTNWERQEQRNLQERNVQSPTKIAFIWSNGFILVGFYLTRTWKIKLWWVLTGTHYLKTKISFWYTSGITQKIISWMGIWNSEGTIAQSPKLLSVVTVVYVCGHWKTCAPCVSYTCSKKFGLCVEICALVIGYTWPRLILCLIEDKHCLYKNFMQCCSALCEIYCRFQ